MYHFIGIGGIGMSGLARILLQKGEQVQGSDIRPSRLTSDLEREGARIFLGHDASLLPPEGEVVYGSDIQDSNEEYAEARRRGLPLIHRSLLLSRLMKGSRPLLVAGSHGKTGTSALLAHVLTSSGLDPSYCIGGIVRNLGSQAGYRRGEWFVAEADESDGSFLHYSPYGAIVTNIGNDHLSHWKTERRLIEGFFRFCQKVERKDLFFWCKDDERLSSLPLEGVGYGFSEGSDLRIFDFTPLGSKSRFFYTRDGRTYGPVEIPLKGRHNALNAAAVIGICSAVGMDHETIFKAVAGFAGAERRSEKKGSAQGVCVYDDYGHHPSEIAATLRGFIEAFPERRIVVVFQPHRFTRVATCFSSFAPSLAAANLVVLTDIYSAGEKPMEGITTKGLYEEIVARGVRHCVYVPNEELRLKIPPLLRPGDVVITMGAGDIGMLGPVLLSELSS